MKRANKTGSVKKLSGNRRNPWFAVLPQTYDENGKPLPLHILSDDKGQKYFPKRDIPDLLLSQWNLKKDNINIDKSEYTFKQVYEEFALKNFPTDEELRQERYTHQKIKGKLGRSVTNNLKSAYSKCKSLYSKPYKSLRKADFEDVILNVTGCGTVINSLANLFKKLDKYALDQDIIIKGYADLIKITDDMFVPVQNQGIPYTYEEINKIWEYQGLLEADITLATIYTGARIEELLFAKINDVFIEDGYFVGGLKTQAGKRRIIPLHHEILPIFQYYYTKNKHNKFLFTINNEEIDYDKQFYKLYNALMTKLDMTHTTHDGRRTLHSELDRLNANKVCVDKIFGHKSEKFGDTIYSKKHLQELKDTIELVDFKSKKMEKITYLKISS